MLGFGHRDVEGLEPVLQTPRDHPLVFQRLRFGQMQLDAQQRDHHYSVVSTRCTEKTSMTSPSLMSLKFARPMPHSKPFVTSETSSLKRLSEAILPVQTTAPSRMSRAWMSPPRVMRPSVTIQPAIVPMRGALNT